MWESLSFSTLPIWTFLANSVGHSFLITQLAWHHTLKIEDHSHCRWQWHQHCHFQCCQFGHFYWLIFISSLGITITQPDITHSIMKIALNNIIVKVTVEIYIFILTSAWLWTGQYIYINVHMGQFLQGGNFGCFVSLFRCASISWIHVGDSVSQWFMFLRFGQPLPDIAFRLLLTVP